MKDENNFSTIPSSYTPKDYRLARFAANTGDADLPLPDIAQSGSKDKSKT